MQGPEQVMSEHELHELLGCDVVPLEGALRSDGGRLRGHCHSTQGGCPRTPGEAFTSDNITAINPKCIMQGQCMFGTHTTVTSKEALLCTYAPRHASSVFACAGISLTR